MVNRHQIPRNIWTGSVTRVRLWDRREQERLRVKTRMSNRYFNLRLARFAENWS